MPNRIDPQPRLIKDKVLSAAVDVAHGALLEVTASQNIGAHSGALQEAERLVTHAFECLLPGYRGWFWTVTVTRASRKNQVTVNEVALLPGEQALLAPDWIPWADRLTPQDITPTDRLPYQANDANLEDFSPELIAGYEDTGLDLDQAQLWELGLGRVRVLSDAGRKAAFRRWYRSDAGPRNQATREAKAPCSTCGYFMKMAGSARQLFGVCANEWSSFDGRVVSLDHGCGSHSETDVKQSAPLWVQAEPVIDESELEVADLVANTDTGKTVEVVE